MASALKTAFNRFLKRTISSTMSYIVFFDGEPQGAAIVERLIQAGFSNVYLATSYPKEKVAVPTGVRGVVGKEFPLPPPAGGSTVA
jgi:hypothetical protein